MGKFWIKNDVRLYSDKVMEGYAQGTPQLWALREPASSWVVTCLNTKKEK